MAGLEPDELYNIGFKPPEVEQAKRLPSWYHGMISRHDAESLLRKHEPVVDGLFLVRKSSKDKGFVLSVVQMSEMCQIHCARPHHATGRLVEDDSLLNCMAALQAHYQIRHEVLEHRDYLTFDTETDRGPLFRSLSGVLHYLLNQPNLLPIPLTQWVSCLTDPGLPHLATESIAFRGDISQTLTDALSDTLAEVTGGDDVYEQPAIYAMQNPGALSEVDSRTGGKVIVCVDEKDRTHRLPDDCKDIEVVPYKMSSASIRREREKSRKIHRSSKESIQAAPPPALPRRPEALQAAAKKPARAYQQFQPAMTGPSGRAIRHMTDEVPADGYYYREVIKEGWLQKLPPLGNVRKGWKMRWFKLCVVISSSESCGPVMLEYYDKSTAPKPKGEINLANVSRICLVDSEDCRAKVLKKTDQDLLFMIQLPQRTYPLQGGSAAEVAEWVSALNETLGLDPTGKRIEPERPQTRAESVRFNGKLVFGGQDGRSGFSCIIDVGTDTLSVEGTSGNPNENLRWQFGDINRFGYVKQLVWFDAAITCDHPGIFCVTTPDAEAIHAAVEDRVKLISDPASLVRNRSLRSNMSWTLKAMLDNATAAQPRLNSTVSHQDVKVLGKLIPGADLGYGGVAIVTKPYTGRKPGELSLIEGQSHDVVKTRAFLADGYWVTDLSLKDKSGARKGSISQRKFGLVKATCVEHYEHGFSDLAEDEDDDLLDGVDATMYAKAGESYEMPVPLRSGSDDYEEPSSSYEEPVPGPAQESPDYETTSPIQGHTKYDYENAGAIKENDRRKGLKPKTSAQPGSHYVNREVVGSHANNGKPVLFGKPP